MKNLVLTVAILFAGYILGSSSNTVEAQSGPSNQNGSDALWHLPKFGELGWFIHASNGKVRACNMDKASVVGERQGPRCSEWR